MNKKNKTIAIWAPLRYANYGDDLQALAFGLMLRQEGYNVKLFQLEESLSEAYGITSCATVDELCQDTSLCIIAGGALLTPFSWIKRKIHKAAIEYERDFKDLFEATLKYPVKFCAISMGGDGKQRVPEKWYSKHRIDFFRSDSFINGTVRLEGDVEQMKKFGKDFTFYPDMLFRTTDYFTPDLLQGTEKHRVGINFKKGRYLDKSLLKAIYKYAAEHDDIEFHFTTTHMQKTGLDYQYVPEHEGKNIFIDRYTSPQQLLGVLASMDVFITSMLHLGLTGLTTGTPFISYRGPGKTKSFLKSIGGDWAIVDDNISFEELKTQFFVKDKRTLYEKYDIMKIEEMKQESLQQYEYCKYIAEKFA